MQQFTIPQFIDVEDKIIGPITTRQFVILLAGAVLIAIFYKIFDFSLFIVATILVFIISSLFSFVKINGRPFHFFILNITQTLKRPGVRVWNHIINKVKTDYEIEEKPHIKQSVIPSTRRYSVSRLAELSLIVDTKGAYKGENKKNF
ncbi:MAG: PrgI family protein [Patescibacteria group bacterium]|nr:PrgI family protein [Patescibacteria group bacterium]